MFLTVLWLLLLLVAIWLPEIAAYGAVVFKSLWRWLRLQHTFGTSYTLDSRSNVELDISFPVFHPSMGFAISGSLYFVRFEHVLDANATGFFLDLWLVRFRFNYWRFLGSR